MKWVFILLMAIANVGFANDTFTAEEAGIIEEQIKTAVTKKFTPQYLKQIEKNAASRYLLFKVGDKFTANSPGRNFTGTIHNIGKITVRVGDFLINKRDYPGYYFDAIFNDRMRKAYVNKYYHHAKNSYRQRAGKYYRKQILAKRPPDKSIVIEQKNQSLANQVRPPPAEGKLVQKEESKKSILTKNNKKIVKENPKTLQDKYMHCFGGIWKERLNSQNEYTFSKNSISFHRFGKPTVHHITNIGRLKGNYNYEAGYQNFVITTKTGFNKPIHWILTHIARESIHGRYNEVFIQFDGIDLLTYIDRKKILAKKLQESPKEMQAAFQKYICDTWISGQDTYVVSKESITYQRFDAPLVWKITKFARLKNDDSKPTNWYQYFVITATRGGKTMHFLLHWGNDIHGGILFLNIAGAKSQSVILRRQKKWNSQSK